MDKFSLKGKTILITGASSGLGKATAIECSNAGASLVITGRNEERLKDTFNKIHNTDNKYIVSDIANEDEIDKLAESCSVIDGVVLCAGVNKTIPIKHINSKEINSLFCVNTIADILLIQKIIKTKKIKNNGSIVLISSIATSFAAKGNALYAASKGALESFSKGLALELSNKRIRCNCIRPGVILTKMAIGNYASYDLTQEEQRYPLGYGEPIDIAMGAVYLLSDASKWITGTTLTIDGGRTLI